MANEVVKQDTLNLSLGTINLAGLTDEQRNSVAVLVAQKQVELAAALAEKKIQLDSSMADIDVATNKIQELQRAGGKFRVEAEFKTATGSVKIQGKKGGWLI